MKLQKASLLALTALCVGAEASCGGDNCGRALRGSSSAASGFCTQYLSTSSVALPTYIGNCDSDHSKISSACSCLLGASSTPSAASTCAASTTTATVTSTATVTNVSGSVSVSVSTVTKTITTTATITAAITTTPQATASPPFHLFAFDNSQTEYFLSIFTADSKHPDAFAAKQARLFSTGSIAASDSFYISPSHNLIQVGPQNLTAYIHFDNDDFPQIGFATLTQISAQLQWEPLGCALVPDFDAPEWQGVLACGGNFADFFATCFAKGEADGSQLLLVDGEGPGAFSGSGCTGAFSWVNLGFSWVDAPITSLIPTATA